MKTASRLANEAEGYLAAAFNLHVALTPSIPANFPHFLLDHYRFWDAHILGSHVLFMEPKEPRNATGDIAKHQANARQRRPDIPIILLLEVVPASLRDRLIAHKTAFLCPKHQLYVPELLLALSEQPLRLKPPPPDQLSPTAQLIIIARLHGMDIDSASLGELAERFDLALMSVSRAFDELETLELIATFRQSRQRRVRFLMEGADLWRASEQRMRSPVRKLRTVRGRLTSDQFVLAGLSALSAYTMLAPPQIERYAVDATSWKGLVRELEVEEAWPGEEDVIEIETWRYNPLPLVQDLIADRISLYLSIRDNPDERVELAAEQLLEPFEW